MLANNGAREVKLGSIGGGWDAEHNAISIVAMPKIFARQDEICLCNTTIEQSMYIQFDRGH